jgi:hypothetical protein
MTALPKISCVVLFLSYVVDLGSIQSVYLNIFRVQMTRKVKFVSANFTADDRQVRPY